jgi:inner membrane protein YidH
VSLGAPSIRLKRRRAIEDAAVNSTEEQEAARRNLLMAGERTELAWWRTGLAALAVAVGIGRLAPELQESGATWPYVLVGIGFAVYGIALFAQGTIRGREEAGPLGEEKHPMGWRTAALAAAGPVLGLAVVALIALP